MGCGKGCQKHIKPVNKLNSIITGWRNILWPDPLIEEIAMARAEICAECTSNDGNWCIDCMCFIPAKARSLAERCLLWEDIDEKYNL